METKEGDRFESFLEGIEVIVKKVMNSMVILESKDGKRQILTRVSSLNNKSFYRKEEGADG